MCKHFAEVVVSLKRHPIAKIILLLVHPLPSWLNRQVKSTWLEALISSRRKSTSTPDASSLNRVCLTWTCAPYVIQLELYCMKKVLLATLQSIWSLSLIRLLPTRIRCFGQWTWIARWVIIAQLATSSTSLWKVSLTNSLASTQSITLLTRLTLGRKRLVASVAPVRLSRLWSNTRRVPRD